MPLPVRSKSINKSNRGASQDVPSSRIPSRNASPTKPTRVETSLSGKNTDERIEAARQRRLSLASDKGGKRNSERNVSTERKTSHPPSSFKTPAKPVRHHVESKPELSRRRGSAGGDDAAAPRRSSSLSKARNDSSTARRSSAHSQRPPSIDASSTTTTSKRTPSHSTHAAKPHGRENQPPTTRRTKSPAPSSTTTTTTTSSIKPFTTHQQHFTPAKKLRDLPAASSSSSSSSPNSPAKQAPNTLEQLKAQTHLLHLSLLYDASPQTYTQWTSSAYSALHARFQRLQAAYASCLRTARTTRQARNLLALTQWSGGNDAALLRKTSVLASVLGELCDLTQGDAAWRGCEAAHAKGWWIPDHEAASLGAYTRLQQHFSAWTHWVESVWVARDRVRGADSRVHTPPSTPTRNTIVENINNDDNDAVTDQETHTRASTRLEPLGDATKLPLRALSSTLDRLLTRLTDLRDPAIPIPIPISLSTPHEENTAPADEPGEGPVPTPKRIVDAAWTLVNGMREEVQLMREIEFEVTIGERAWEEQMVREIGGEVVSTLR